MNFTCLALIPLLLQDAQPSRPIDRDVLQKGTSVEIQFVGATWEDFRTALKEQSGSSFRFSRAWRDGCEAAGGVTLELGATNYWTALCELARTTGSRLDVANVDTDGPYLTLKESTRRVGEPVVAGAFCVTLQRSPSAFGFDIAPEPWIQNTVEVVAYQASVRGRGMKPFETGSEDDATYHTGSEQTLGVGSIVQSERIGSGEVDVSVTVDLRVRIEDEVFESGGDLGSMKRRAAKAFGGRLAVVKLGLEGGDGRWGVELSVPTKKGPLVEDAWLIDLEGRRLRNAGSMSDPDGTYVLWFDREDLPEDPAVCRVGLSRLGEHIKHRLEVSFDDVCLFPDSDH